MWKKKLSKAGIDTFTRPHTTSAIDCYRGIMVVKGDIELYKALFLDIDYYPKVFHTTVKTEIVEHIGPQEQIVYVVNKSFGAKARDYYARCNWEQDQRTGGYTFSWVIEPQYPEIQGYVRVPTLQVVNRLRPVINTNEIEVSHEAHVEPGGKVPAMLVNRLLTEVPWQTLYNIRHHIQKGIYPQKAGGRWPLENPSE